MDVQYVVTLEGTTERIDTNREKIADLLATMQQRGEADRVRVDWIPLLPR